MKLAIIGCGAIGTALANALNDIDVIDKIYLLNKDHDKALELANSLNKAVAVLELATCIDELELVIEAASIEAVHQYGAFVLSHRKNLMVMSVGAFADETLRHRLLALARENKVKIYLPSGAIVGLDGVKSAASARLDSVELITRKPPRAFKGNEYLRANGVQLETMDEPMTLFEGTVADAIERFPKNINIAVGLSLATVGGDHTTPMGYLAPAGARAGVSTPKSAEIGERSEPISRTSVTPSELLGSLGMGKAHTSRPRAMNEVNCPQSVKVKIICDPSIDRTVHKVSVRGAFGELQTETRNMPMPDNPRTSYLAALSAIATVKKLVEPLQVGT